MAKATRLEVELTAITQEFVARIVSTIRSASFGDVVGFLPGGPAVWKPAGPSAARATRTRKQAVSEIDPRARTARGPKPRQTRDKRAELGARVLDALSRSSRPLGVRAIASDVGVAADLLAAPLRELRAAGRIAKHGEKRNTTYSAA